MSDFKVGDRVEVVHDFEGDEGSFYVGKQGSVYSVKDALVGVEIDDDDGESYFDQAELRLVPRIKSAARYTQEEWNDQINQYESQIERLNELLDEIQEMVSPGSSDRVDPGWIQYVLDKRTFRP